MDNNKIDVKGQLAIARSFLFLLFLGVVGVVSPWTSVFIATFRGVTDLSRFNSSMLMFLSVLILVFLIIESASALYDGNKKTLLFSIVLAVLTLASFLYNLLIFVSI